ncbi:hypothetical protein BN2537_53 [Streptomyces venezuelae]|nr:hypothetical protein BN2537_53 [Streptomyces venezuelae]
MRPGDTGRPTWAVYEREVHLGTVHARPDGDGMWHVQEAGDQCDSLDDAVRMRAGRRPGRVSASRWGGGRVGY